MKTRRLPPENLTPGMALQLLKEGNHRFINNISVNRDLLELMRETKDQQYPFAAVFSCMDSRTSAELIFDQGFGDIFSIRMAGNVISDHVLGSLEYTTAVAGAKLIVVLGHTNCGAIQGACDHVEMGYLTGLLEQIKPAMDQVTDITENRNGKNPEFVNEVAGIHVRKTVHEIHEKSHVIRSLLAEKKIGIIAGMYNLSTGKVTFFDEEADFSV
jgi:carbonic anhydrase